MKKILMVLEDYNELVFMETLLKKVGFDIISSRTEVSYSEKLMSFVPDLIVATGGGSKVDAKRLAKKTKRRGGYPKILAFFPRGHVPPLEELSVHSIDAALDSPATPRTMITACCQLLNVDAGPVLAKFEKLPIAQGATEEVASDVQYVVGNQGGSGHQTVKGEAPDPETTHHVHSNLTSANEASRKRFEKALSQAEKIGPGGLNKQAVQAEVKDFREYERSHPEVKDIDNARKEFVKKLFQKK